MFQVGFPFSIDSRGHLANPDWDQHIRELIEQVLFTAPGQRVNRPDFGAGLLSTVFAAQSMEMLSTTELLVQGSLQRWLGELIIVEQVLVEPQDSALKITIRYVVRSDQVRRVAVFDSGQLPWQR